MDTTAETPTSDTVDLVVLEPVEVEIKDDTSSLSSEVTKTLATSTATAVVLFGGYAVATALLPKVRAWLASRKKDVAETAEEKVHTVATKVKNRTEKD